MKARRIPESGRRLKEELGIGSGTRKDFERRGILEHLGMAFPKKKKKYRSPIEGPLRRLPGQSIREERERLFDDKVMGYFFAALGMWLLAGLQWLYEWTGAPPNPRFTTLVAVIVTVYCAYRIWRIRPEFRNLNLGEKGERRVSEVLRTLRDRDYVTFDDLLLEGVNVDHVVVVPVAYLPLRQRRSRYPVTSAELMPAACFSWRQSGVQRSAKTGSRIRRDRFSRIEAMDASRHLGESGCCSTGVAN
jgi:hypothetical protein